MLTNTAATSAGSTSRRGGGFEQQARFGEERIKIGRCPGELLAALGLRIFEQCADQRLLVWEIGIDRAGAHFRLAPHIGDRRAVKTLAIEADGCRFQDVPAAGGEFRCAEFWHPAGQPMRHATELDH